MRCLLLLPVLLLAGCAKPAWVRLPALATPDFSTWFEGENAIPVEEVAQSPVCHTAGGETVVTLLPNLLALRTWVSARGVEPVSHTGKPLPDTAYAVVEFGQRENSGYGLAVSRRAGMSGETLLLKATFFDPQQGRWASSEPSSPCVFVSLPPGEFRLIKLLDQTGLVRAATDTRG